jgi:hypothetical protein
VHPINTVTCSRLPSDFAVVQHKLVTPTDFATFTALEHQLLAFEHRCLAMAQPCRWRFTRAHLHQLIAEPPTVRPAA